MYFHKLINIYDKISYIIAPSDFTLSKIKFPKDRLARIETFVKAQQKYYGRLGDYGLFVGRIEEEKGLMTAIKAFEKTDYKLKIVGPSSTGYTAILKKYLSDNKIRNVELIGPRYGKELSRLYKRSRFFLMPSEWYENMPNVVLEAMSYSRPIIASDIGSLKEIITDNHNGLLFEPKNIIELREKIKRLFKDDKLTTKLGRNAYQDAITRYNPDIHYQKLINIFNKAISEEKLRWKR
jgi:glycosyltransferase involved in cell wall biosynthesis